MYDKKKQFDELVNAAQVAMLTTIAPDGNLRSRAMANQKRAAGADLWFVATEGAEKLDDIARDPRVNVAYYRDGSREWASISGLARLVRDPAKIAELYEEDWRMWFPDNGDPRHGTPDDPRIVLIGVDYQVVTFFTVEHALPVVLYELAKGWLTGKPPQIGEVKTMKKPAA